MLIDTGTAKGSEVVAANIAGLGFKITDVKALLGGHEHFRSCRRHGAAQQASGAPVLVGAGAVDVIRTGKDDPRDPQAGLHDRWSP